LVHVPASGYYAWQRGQQPALIKSEPAWETALIKVFGMHKRCFGTRHLQVALRKEGYQVVHQRLRTAMRRRGLYALQSNAFAPHATDSTHGLRCVPDPLLDQPTPTQANRVQVSDITRIYHLVGGEWAYLYAFQNMASKHVVGGQVRTTMPGERVPRALQ
jgi:putative transposase